MSILTRRGALPQLELFERAGHHITRPDAFAAPGFIPWFPLATGNLADSDGPLSHAATQLAATPGQVALAWLLHKSPVMLPIPGTSKVKHLESNTNAAVLELDEQLAAELEQSVPPSAATR